MNFGQVKDLVWYWLDDPDEGYFTDTQVSRWVNNAQLELQKQLIQAGENWYLKCAATYTVQNQECYVLPQDFLKLNHLELIVSGTAPNEIRQILKHSTQAESDYFNYGSGQPLTFFLEKNCLIVRPVPDTAYLLRMHYSYRVTEMTQDAEVPDCPEQYHEYLSILAAIDGKLKDERDPTSLLTKRTYYENMLKADAQSRLQDSPREVVSTYDDGFGSMF